MEKKITETKEEVKEPEQKKGILVVTELPKQDVRQAQLEDGTILTLIPLNEAITELLERVRRIDKTL